MTDMYSAHEWLKKFYHHLLLYSEEGSKAKKYLINRGITEDSMKTFNIGYSPEKANTTLVFLKEKGFSYTPLIKGKVLHRYENGNLTDPFRNRITFPVQDFRGRTVAFGGRVIEEDEKVKYLNSSDTKIYQKGNNLFGLDLAVDEIKEQGYAILLEGYFDVIALHQAGIKNSVATLGTAITENQALMIKDITSDVVIAYDGDDAGMENSFKTASILEDVGCSVKIAHIKDNLDPDDYVRKFGQDAFLSEVVLSAKKRMDSFIAYKESRYDKECPTNRYMIVSESIEELVTEDVGEHKELLEKLGKTLNISIEDVYKVIERRAYK